MDTLIIFLKAHVKAHTRRLASGKVVHVGAYTTKAPSAGTGERDIATGDLFDSLPDKARGRGVPGAAPVKHKTAMEAAQHDVRNGETLALFFDPTQQHEEAIKPAGQIVESKPQAAQVDENSSIDKEPAVQLTPDQRNQIAKDDTLMGKYGPKGEGSRGRWKEAARGGQFDHLWAEHLANEKAAADAEKANRKAKNDAWREKNMPKLIAAKKLKAKMEDEKREADRQYAERQAKIKENIRQRIADENAAMDAAERKQDASYPTGPKLVDGLPASGRVSSDDPSIYGSWLLGHEGELWSRVRAYAPTKKTISEVSVATQAPASGAPATPKKYLRVPFADKDRAKAAGARWDAAVRQWYWPGGAMPEALSRYA